MSTRTTSHLSMFFAGAITTLILMLLVTIAIPPFRATATDWMDFERADDNRLETPARATRNFAEFGDLLLAEHLTEYALREPTALPEEYRFATGKHWPEFDMIELTYRRPHPYSERRTQSFYLRQWPNDPSNPSTLIGEHAQVETVQIGDVQGQFVTGAWTQSPDSEALAEEQTRTLYWNLSEPQQRLRWQDGNVWLELGATSGVVTQQELIDLAESVRITEE